MVEIVLEGPGKNALSTPLMENIIHKLQEADGAPVLLQGKGDAFCAGLNLKELVALNAAGMETFLRKLEQMVEELYTYSGPVVAALNGHAIAGGLLVGLCCDHVVLSSQPAVKVGLNEVALGLAFPPITLAVAQDRIPKHTFNDAIFRARLVGPDEAFRLGLVDELAEDAVQVAKARLLELSAHPKMAYEITKAHVRGVRVDSARNESKFQEILPAWTSPALKQRLEKWLVR